MTAPSPLCRYVGVDSRGVARGGVLPLTEVPDFVQNKFATGWRVLTVKVSAEEEVGGIGPNLDHPRRRTWWALFSTAEQASA